MSRIGFIPPHFNREVGHRPSHHRHLRLPATDVGETRTLGTLPPLDNSSMSGLLQGLQDLELVKHGYDARALVDRFGDAYVRSRFNASQLNAAIAQTPAGKALQARYGSGENDQLPEVRISPKTDPQNVSRYEPGSLKVDWLVDAFRSGERLSFLYNDDPFPGK